MELTITSYYKCKFLTVYHDVGLEITKSESVLMKGIYYLRIILLIAENVQ